MVGEKSKHTTFARSATSDNASPGPANVSFAVDTNSPPTRLTSTRSSNPSYIPLSTLIHTLHTPCLAPLATQRPCPPSFPPQPSLSLALTSHLSLLRLQTPFLTFQSSLAPLTAQAASGITTSSTSKSTPKDEETAEDG